MIKRQKKCNMQTRFLYKGKFLHFIEENTWEYVARSQCSGIVIVVALTSRGQVILTEQYRTPVKKNVVEFPAGLVNDEIIHKNESLRMAAKRELLEETGYHAKVLKKITSGPAAAGITSDIFTIFYAPDVIKIREAEGDGTESIIVHEVPLYAVEKWLEGERQKGKLVDPKIYAGLYFLNKYNKPEFCMSSVPPRPS